MKHRRQDRCSFCGRFMSVECSDVVWTSYGSSAELEPPDEEYSHFSCWQKASVESKSLIWRTSWQRPTIRLQDLLEKYEL